METALVAFLAPFLGSLLKGAHGAAEEAGRRAGGEAWSLARDVWQRLGPRVDAKAAARESAADLAASPDDPRARGALELQLEKILHEDSALAGELAALLEDARRRGLAGDVVFHGPVHADRGGVVAGRIQGGVSTNWRDQDR